MLKLDRTRNHTNTNKFKWSTVKTACGMAMFTKIPPVFFVFGATILPLIRGDFNVVILHTNDVHARVEQINKYSSKCSESDAAENKCYGGVARRYAAIEDIRRNYSNVLLLDAGDEFQGSAWFSYYNGLESSHFMNQMKYDAMVLGNHEFDNGVEGLLRPFLENATFPVLACNIDASGEPELQNHISPYVTLNVAGQKIGIVGYITEDTVYLTAPAGIANLRFLDVTTSVRRYVDILLSEGVDKVIGLGHSGITSGKALASAIPELDIIIEGHSNTFLYNGEEPDIEIPLDAYPVVVKHDGGGKTLVYQAYAYGKYLGMADVTFNDDGDVIEWEGNPILLDGSWVQDADTLTEVEEWHEPLVQYGTTLIGSSYVVLEGGNPPCRVKECNFGSFIADALLYQHLRSGPNSTEAWSDVAISIMNGGGIRASFDSGPITLGNILEVLPFRNEVEKVWIEGRILRRVLEHSVTNLNPEVPPGRFLQVSGIQVAYNVDLPEGSRIDDVKIRCSDCTVPRFEPLENRKEYAVIAHSFLTQGGDGYDMLRDNIIRKEYFGTLLSDSVTEYIKQVSPLTQGEEGRIRFVKNDVKTAGASSLVISHIITFTLLLTWSMT